MAKHILSRKPPAKPGRPPNSSYTLPKEKLEQREKAFVIYRDMGKARSLGGLAWGDGPGRCASTRTRASRTRLAGLP